MHYFIYARFSFNNLFFREIEVINKKEKKEMDVMYLNVQFPRFIYQDTEYAVIYFEDDGDDVLQVHWLFIVIKIGFSSLITVL